MSNSDTSVDGLQLASEEIDPLLNDLDVEVSDTVVDNATEYAERADFEHPINRSPVAVAAGALYFACLLNNEKITQATIVDASPASEHALRESYIEILKHEGFQHPRFEESPDPAQPSFIDRLLDFFSGGPE